VPQFQHFAKGAYSASRAGEAELHAGDRSGLGLLPRRPPRLPTGQRTAIARSFLPMECTMFASENCSKLGCFLEAALPGVAPAFALIWMLSFAFSSRVM
jgi:hypothetical protein